MRSKFKYLVAIIAATAALTACDPPADDNERPAEPIAYATTETTQGDSDGPAVDRDAYSVPSELSEAERARLDGWHGQGDAPFGDGANDGRFRDVRCGVETGRVLNGYSGGQGCAYSDGTYAAQGVAYYEGAWHWGPVTLSSPLQCPEESDCVIRWDHATTSPVVVAQGG